MNRIGRGLVAPRLDDGRSTRLLRSIELGDDEPGQADGVVERLHLRQRVLAVPFRR